MSTCTTRGCVLLLIKKHSQLDLASNPFKFMIIWGIPILVLICSTLLVSRMLIGWIWAISLLWMGVACLFNAKKCKRTHCFYTGPFFILMAIVSLLFGNGFIGLSDNGWIWIGGITATGGILIWNFSESIFGKYMIN